MSGTLIGQSASQLHLPKEETKEVDNQEDAKSLISICSLLEKGPTYENMRPITYAESRTLIRR
jgi:hypothetical protein